MSSPDLYLAIDCGGTKTAAVLCTPEGTILARAIGGGSNFSCLGLDAFLKCIAGVTSSALSTALQSSVTITPPTGPETSIAGTPPYNLRAAWLGVAGRVIISNDTHLLAAPVRTLSDVRTAVAVVAGTGSTVVSFREGTGGFDVGRTAVRALLKQQDEGTTGVPVEHGTLREKLSKNLASTNPLPRERRLSSLCPIVFEAAFEDGDSLAIEVVEDCAQKLAMQIIAVLRTSEQEENPRKVRADSSVLCLGGSLCSIDRYRELVLLILKGNGQISNMLRLLPTPREWDLFYCSSAGYKG
ncbi:hypothetical protein BGY98DRAFT_1090301 [Russula aff. rugulosa BPL654]|nr:hypothetical protein BGY98DRAFT_1090301 [Russula aff. rugulosa BPL654]